MNTTENLIAIVVGSWGAYNGYDENCLGSDWLELNNFKSWNEIEQELKRQGFELTGKDEELFIQDIEDFPTQCINWNAIHPQEFFELLQQAGVFTDTDKYEKMLAYIEVQSFEMWQDLVLKHGDVWDDDIYIYPKYDWYDYGKELFYSHGIHLPKFLEMFYDFEALGEHFKHYDVQEYSNGLIEIL